jgi:hypothetical protein
MDNSNAIGADCAKPSAERPTEGGVQLVTPPHGRGKLRPGWQKGQSGNPKGRPKGSRDKLGEHFIHELYKHWKKNTAVLQELRENRPDVYVKVVASLLPQKLQAEVDVNVTSHEQRVAERAKLIAEYESKLIDVTPSPAEPDNG